MGEGDTPSFIEDFSKKSRPTFAKWSKLLNKEGVNGAQLYTEWMGGGHPLPFYRRFFKKIKTDLCQMT